MLKQSAHVAMEGCAREDSLRTRKRAARAHERKQSKLQWGPCMRVEAS